MVTFILLNVFVTAPKVDSGLRKRKPVAADDDDEVNANKEVCG